MFDENTVKATFNARCEILTGLSGKEAGGAVRKLHVLTPYWCRKFPVLVL